MKNGCVLLMLLLSIGACKDKAGSENEPLMNIDEFYDYFPPLKTGFVVADSTLARKPKDTTTISQQVLASFTGDSLMNKYFTNNTGTIIYPYGKLGVKKAETYFIIRTASGARKALYVLAFDKQKNFKAMLPLLIPDNDPQTTQSATIDSRYTITLNRQRKKPNGDPGYRKEAYVYNNSGIFNLILTESNDELPANAPIANPLDTVSRKQKFSADYVKDKRNLISIRDGRRPSQMRFFVHFEKDKGTCKGELRGEAIFIKPNVAQYKENGDPCVLEFTFSSTAVSLREIEGCGNYRDIKCFFEGSFPRKKETKTKPAVKKK